MKNIYTYKYNKSNKLNLCQNKRIRIMSDIVNKLNLMNKNILDIGCYDGTFLMQIKNTNNKFHGIEASNFGIAEAFKKGIEVKQFFFNDLDKLPYGDCYFDLIIAGEIIEHIYDTDFFLSEVFRILKPGGFFLLSTPNIASLGRRIFLLLGKNPIIEVSPNEKESSGHIRYFTFQTIEKILQKHNFKILIKKSDIVNFSSNGNINSSLLQKIFPGIGQSIICLCKK